MYIDQPDTVERLGATGAVVVTPEQGAGADGSPLQGALAFFLRGTREALAALLVAGAGTAVLVGVTVFGVTRMGVRERLETIRVVRATGARPRTVVGVFAARGVLLSAVGAALGYALGVILPNAAVSVAVASGRPVSLPLAMTEPMAVALVPVVLWPIVVGAAAGAIAAYSAATRPPAQIAAPRVSRRAVDASVEGSGIRARLTPRILAPRLVVPTAATLAAFVVFATVAAGLWAAVGPVAATDANTLVAPEAPHPLVSQVPEAYADGLAAQGIDASVEILLLEVVDGRPFVAVGADFERYAAVHDATVTAGRTPAGQGEASIGSSLAATLDVEVGDRLVLGGSTREGFTTVRVVGRFDAPGATAGQLVVPLETARHLTEVRPGRVHIITADRLPEPSAAPSTVGVVGVVAPDLVPANTTAVLEVTLRNDGLEPAPVTAAVRYRGETYSRTVDVGALGTRTVAIEIPTGPSGHERVRVDGIERPLRVIEPDDITITHLPPMVPLDSRPLVRVETMAGDPVPNATVSVDGQDFRTDEAGRTRVAFEDPGRTGVVATAGDRTAFRTVSVSTDTERRLTASLTVVPLQPSVLVRPTARVELSNPWAVPLERELVLDGSGSDYRETVSIDPGSGRTIEVPLDRQPPDSYQLELRADGQPVAEAHYVVTGDDRLASALASSGRRGQSGLGRAMEAALGNLELVVGVVVGLAALMTIGATAATFAAGVQARTRTLGVHRATGASPARIGRLVLRDALVLGVASTVIGLLVGLIAVFAFAQLGVLTILGVSIPPVPPVPIVLATVAAALGLTLLGAGIATWGVLNATPGSLLRLTPSRAGGREVRDD